MDQNELDPIALFLLDSYADTAGYSRSFRDTYDQPPTTMAKAHHLRAIVQALANHSDRYLLAPEYVEFGRVEICDLRSDRSYLLRSDRAVVVEDAMTRPSLFGAAKYITSPIVLLVFKFHRDGLDLSVAGSKHLPSSNHLKPSGEAAHVGTWPYIMAGGNDPDRRFSQDASDAWDELGGGIEEDGAGEQP